MWSTTFNAIGRVTTTVTPEIYRFSATKGSVGTTVTITRRNLAGGTRLAFSGTTATVSSDSASTIIATVPAGATTGPLSVTTATGTATSSGSFTVT